MQDKTVPNVFNNSFDKKAGKDRVDTKMWTIISWFGPQKSGGGKCVHFYPDIPGGAKWRCATMYEETFWSLPDEIREKCETGQTIPGSAPGPEDAFPLKQPFRLETWINLDGTDSKDVSRFVGDAEQAQAQAGSTPASFSLQQAGVPMTFNVLPSTEVLMQFGEIVNESKLKADALYTRLTDFFGGELSNEGAGEWQRMVASWIWRDANDQWRVVRPSLLRAVEESPSINTDVILNGEQKYFLSDLARHQNVTSKDVALEYCKALGIDSSAESGEGRVAQAQRVWLFATLVGPLYGFDHERAAQIVDVAFPDGDLF